MAPTLNQVDLIVADMEATLAFYRALGLEIPDTAIWRTASGIHHVDLAMPGGVILHFDSEALAGVYDRGWRRPAAQGTRTVLTFSVPLREDVDRIHDALTSLGHPSAQAPWDAFWGSRYAIVCDPDGSHVGIMSPMDPSKRAAPPDL